MSKENGVTRREMMKKSAIARAALAAANALGAYVTPAMAAGVPRKWNKEIDVVLVGTSFWGLAACITAGDPGKITLLF
jgi:uncharacterized membrane protein